MSKHDSGSASYELVFERLVGKFAPKYPNAVIVLTRQPVSEGNAYVILIKLRKALKNSGVDQVEINLILEEAQSGNYEHLLKTVARNVTVI